VTAAAPGARGCINPRLHRGARQATTNPHPTNYRRECLRFRDNWIGKLTGSTRVRTMIDAGADTGEVVAGRQEELAAFRPPGTGPDGAGGRPCAVARRRGAPVVTGVT